MSITIVAFEERKKCIWLQKNTKKQYVAMGKNGLEVSLIMRYIMTADVEFHHNKA